MGLEARCSVSMAQDWCYALGQQKEGENWPSQLVSQASREKECCRFGLDKNRRRERQKNISKPSSNSKTNSFNFKAKTNITK
jgi:hypothetical protein